MAAGVFTVLFVSIKFYHHVKVPANEKVHSGCLINCLALLNKYCISILLRDYIFLIFYSLYCYLLHFSKCIEIQFSFSFFNTILESTEETSRKEYRKTPEHYSINIISVVSLSVIKSQLICATGANDWQNCRPIAYQIVERCGVWKLCQNLSRNQFGAVGGGGGG